MPWSGMMMAVVLASGEVVAKLKVKATGGRLLAPSWSCRVALMTPPLTFAAVKENARATMSPPAASAP